MDPLHQPARRSYLGNAYSSHPEVHGPGVITAQVLDVLRLFLDLRVLKENGPSDDGFSGCPSDCCLLLSFTKGNHSHLLSFQTSDLEKLLLLGYSLLFAALSSFSPPSTPQ